MRPYLPNTPDCKLGIQTAEVSKAYLEYYVLLVTEDARQYNTSVLI
jgi:hypothetical protein